MNVYTTESDAYDDRCPKCLGGMHGPDWCVWELKAAPMVLALYACVFCRHRWACSWTDQGGLVALDMAAMARGPIARDVS